MFIMTTRYLSYVYYDHQIFEKNRIVKEALSPAAAECLRAVFAAFMWHEGIVHDAMACASFLKFHPDLTKEMSKFVKVK